MKYVCADCGHEQDTMFRCFKCNGFRVILQSMAEQLFGPNWRKCFDADPNAYGEADLPEGKMFDKNGTIVDKPGIPLAAFNVLLRWVDHLTAFYGERGRPLDTGELFAAEMVGVKHPEKVRVAMVDAMPQVPDTLKELASEFLNPEHAIGLTLGHVILIRKDAYSRKLMQHELRHVQQVEQHGGAHEFMTQYVMEVVKHGYENAPLERDAVAHE